MTTPFQDKVYALLKQIPAGKVTTYKILAEQLGMKGYQAIGRACRENPFFPKVPCHRVINSDGSVGGYQGRKNHPQKEVLLCQEGIPIEQGNVREFERYLFRFGIGD